jgi:hypothetical protein
MSDADIVARVSLYPTSQGGRQGPTPADRFGCLVVPENSPTSFDCRLLLSGSGALHPGDSAVVPIKFLDADLVREVFKVGSRFLLRDGAVIGEGVVQALLFD